MSQPMILGWYTVHLLSRTQAGIRCPGFFGAASDSRSVLDLESDTLEDLGGAGVTGGTTGTAVGQSTTITPSSRAAELLITADSIAVTSAEAASATATSATAMRFTEVRAFTVSQECTLARSVALITAEMSEAFPPAGGPALEVAASMEVVPMAVADGTR